MKDPLLEKFMKDPMAQWEFWDTHNSLPLWVKIKYNVRLFLGL